MARKGVDQLIAQAAPQSIGRVVMRGVLDRTLRVMSSGGHGLGGASPAKGGAGGCKRVSEERRHMQGGCRAHSPSGKGFAYTLETQ